MEFFIFQIMEESVGMNLQKIVLFSGLECKIQPISSEKLRQKSVRLSFSVLDLYKIKNIIY